MKVFAFIDAQKAVFDVKTLCQVCSVSRSAFYDWAAAVAAGPDQALWDEAVLADAIFDIWKRSKGRYGAPRITAQLCRRGRCVNHKRVERLMAELGIAGKCGRRKMRTTIRDPREKPAVDLVDASSAGTGPTSCGSGISRTSPPARDGCMWPVSSMLAAAGCWAGRSLITCAPRSAPTPCGRRWPPGAGPASTVWSSIPTTAVSIRAMTTRRSALICTSFSRWEQSAIHTIMQWLKASGLHSASS